MVKREGERRYKYGMGGSEEETCRIGFELELPGQTYKNHKCIVCMRLKHLPPMRETWVRSLGREDPLEKEMATHSSILAWRIPWTEKPGRLQSTGLQRVGHD